MRNKFRILCIAFVFLLSACNLGAEPATPTVTEDVATEVPVSEAAVEPSATPVQHVMVPGELPEQQLGLAGDQDSSTTAPENRAPAGDRFTFGRYERPFNANSMDVYYSNIDILFAATYTDDTWVYGTVTVKDNGSGCSLTSKYGFEIDLNIDGGGDVLVMVAGPSSTEWTTTGVQVWIDENNDVGGSLKTVTDESSSEFDGYETQTFGEGIGDDPDYAWARISPNEPCEVQMAVKNSVLDGSLAYMVGMWAGNELFDPAFFEQNDLYSQDQAGSPLKEFEFYYPIKEVFELDNACRMAVGFQPNGSEPGICPVPPGPAREAPPPPPGQTCPPPSVYYCSPTNPNYCICLYPQG